VTPLIALTIPSPSQGVWHLGPLPIRAYALCIIAGIIVAIAIAEKRWVARGGKYGEMQDLALWAVPFGLVGGRLYHVMTDYELYFGEGKHPIQALYVWRGGLGIWGAIALGAVGVVIGARRKGILILPAMDVMAPAAVVAQAIGRWGNYFNQELFGRETDLPWKLAITKDSHGDTVPTTYHHPTFLYECLWDLGVFGLLIWADRRFKLGYGRVMALYMMGYTLGRGWIENLRVDSVQMNDVFGLRLNVWTSIVVFIVGAIWFTVSARRHPGREPSVYVDAPEPAGRATPAGRVGPRDEARIETMEEGEPPVVEEGEERARLETLETTTPDRPLDE
jgi:prolipoprotein diacylglyceryl transferase